MKTGCPTPHIFLGAGHRKTNDERGARGRRVPSEIGHDRVNAAIANTAKEPVCNEDLGLRLLPNPFLPFL